jgi:uncharacterized surface protein with fasciclin (FAS1) repeats
VKNLMRLALLPALLCTLAFGSTRVKADDIVDVAAAAPNFKTLVAAVKAAGLVDTLKGEGPFTVFAPTDAAFAKLPKGTVESLLKPENKAKLIAILTYHVVKGKVMAADVMKLKSGSRVPTVEGQSVVIKVSKMGVMVDKAKVIKTDIEASNGVIHVIDTVLMPPMSKMKHSKMHTMHNKM